MNRSSYVYILALAIFAAGMWLIIRLGSSHLHAREDLAGDWELTPTPTTDGGGTIRMKVEQSGRFFRISLPNSPPMQMKMANEEQSGERKLITLSGASASVRFDGTMGGDQWGCSFDGATKGHFDGRLIERTYPKTTSAKASSKAPANAR